MQETVAFGGFGLWGRDRVLGSFHQNRFPNPNLKTIRVRRRHNGRVPSVRSYVCVAFPPIF